MAFYFVSTFANAQTPTKQRPYGYRGLKIITSLRLRFPDFQRELEWKTLSAKASEREVENRKAKALKGELETAQKEIGNLKVKSQEGAKKLFSIINTLSRGSKEDILNLRETAVKFMDIKKKDQETDQER
ncbi:hypothetical protein bplSymb_SCF08601P001 [Bathymodiolus platifrons methanotrophic gill symbiont]|uniref:hypothetical protein n=1 Tax=Bathymodiolus platifrons methanotrophic gill symbiont TaxID=113268 RepID=UPI000B40B3E4|nr:hypothetical protein [Bathymodiolus platifrons methanotrophic gill symbiont]GAW87433.1 hypothetical protein bplSymb_SCF08601P001 [Bathymodiolus platifrons methanotrophic gill symbiont]GFO76394.1 hypothetical protein BPLS_P4141 [Bathymodiolus platifrons methanotrophic gill symbiont]